MNRDHWLLYLTSANTQPLLPSDASLRSSFSLSLPAPVAKPKYQDHTVEILMTHLAPSARAQFFPAQSQITTSSSSSPSGHVLGSSISHQLGIDKLFPASETRLDSYGFDPCGYSANAVIGTGMPEVTTSPGKPGGGYFTIHVTPEEGWSYASFECNVPLPFAPSTLTTSASSASLNDPTNPGTSPTSRPNLTQLIRNVVNIFQPGRLSITLFVSTPADPATGVVSETEAKAWEAFGTELLGKEYGRKDRIGYEFDGYDLVFACFEKRGWTEGAAMTTLEV